MAVLDQWRCGCCHEKRWIISGVENWARRNGAGIRTLDNNLKSTSDPKRLKYATQVQLAHRHSTCWWQASDLDWKLRSCVRDLKSSILARKHRPLSTVRTRGKIYSSTMILQLSLSTFLGRTLSRSSTVVISHAVLIEKDDLILLFHRIKYLLSLWWLPGQVFLCSCFRFLIFSTSSCYFQFQHSTRRTRIEGLVGNYGASSGQQFTIWDAATESNDIMQIEPSPLVEIREMSLPWYSMVIDKDLLVVASVSIISRTSAPPPAHCTHGEPNCIAIFKHMFPRARLRNERVVNIGRDGYAKAPCPGHTDYHSDCRLEI